MENQKDLGIDYLNQGKYEEAIGEFEKNYEVTKNKWEFYNSLGNVEMARGDHEKARELYEKSLEENPNFGLAWSNLSASLAELGKYKEAIAAAKKALEILPNEMGGIHLNLIPQLENEIEKYKLELLRNHH